MFQHLCECTNKGLKVSDKKQRAASGLNRKRLFTKREKEYILVTGATVAGIIDSGEIVLADAVSNFVSVA